MRTQISKKVPMVTQVPQMGTYLGAVLLMIVKESLYDARSFIFLGLTLIGLLPRPISPVMLPSACCCSASLPNLNQGSQLFIFTLGLCQPTEKLLRYSTDKCYTPDKSVPFAESRLIQNNLNSQVIKIQEQKLPATQATVLKGGSSNEISPWHI